MAGGTPCSTFSKIRTLPMHRSHNSENYEIGVGPTIFIVFRVALPAHLRVHNFEHVEHVDNDGSTCIFRVFKVVFPCVGSLSGGVALAYMKRVVPSTCLEFSKFCIRVQFDFP
jgi:hypothetical protein